jgi:hypothetical protein
MSCHMCCGLRKMSLQHVACPVLKHTVPWLLVLQALPPCGPSGQPCPAVNCSAGICFSQELTSAQVWSQKMPCKKPRQFSGRHPAWKGSSLGSTQSPSPRPPKCSVLAVFLFHVSLQLLQWWSWSVMVDCMAWVSPFSYLWVTELGTSVIHLYSRSRSDLCLVNHLSAFWTTDLLSGIIFLLTKLHLLQLPLANTCWWWALHFYLSKTVFVRLSLILEID